MDTKYYFKENVIIEPLVNNWYAWGNVLSPMTSPLYLKNSHMKIMKSYINNPAVHAAAMKNPNMLGGPFIDYDGKRVDEVKELLEKIEAKNKDQIVFAEAIEELHSILESDAKGFSMLELYEKVPEPLKGFVELTYDVNNNPSFRFIEQLLYDSDVYDESVQSLVFSLVEEDHRSFVLSTPRIDDGSQMHVNIPFSSLGIDHLLRTRYEPQSLSSIQDFLNLSTEELERFKQFLTTEKPVQRANSISESDGVRIRYFGHACVLIETESTSILIDPFISYEYPAEIERFTYADLPEEIDYVLITHNHQDHFMVEPLLQLRHKIKNIVVPRNARGHIEDPSLALILKNLNFKNVHDLDDLEDIIIPDGKITTLPFFGEHADLKIYTKAAHLVEVKGKKILLAADSSNLEIKLYERLYEKLGNIDTIFIGMESQGAPLSWLYGALMPTKLERKMDQSRRLNGSDFQAARDIVTMFNPKQVYIYAMGIEPWTGYIMSVAYTDESGPIIESNKLLEMCKNMEIETERLSVKKEFFI